MDKALFGLVPRIVEGTVVVRSGKPVCHNQEWDEYMLRRIG